VLSKVLNKYVAVVVVLVLLFATGIKIHSALADPPGTDLNYKALKRIDRTADEFSFAVFGDNQNSISIFNNLLARVNRDDVDFAFDNGDLVFDGEMPKYRFFLDQVKTLNKPLLTSMGNHETYENGRGIYYDIFGPFYYSFTVGRSYFIVLDNANADSIDPPQMEWLKGELEKGRAYRHTFVFMHVPLFDPRKSGLALAHAMESVTNARRLNSLFDQYGVTMLFTSHLHGYFTGTWGKTPYIITGGAGGELPGSDPEHFFFHYIKVKVSDAGVDYEVVKLKSPRSKLDRLFYAVWVNAYAFVALHYLDLLVWLALLYLLVFALYWLEKRGGWLAGLRKSKGRARSSEEGGHDEDG
jgi:hypothetical protein